MNRQRYVVLVFLVAGLLAGLVMQAAVVSLLAQFAMPDDRVAGLISTSTLAALATGVITTFALLRTRKAVRFTDEVVGELAKVTWPTRDETTSATTTVIAATLFLAALLAVYDLLWKSVADWVLFTEG